MTKKHFIALADAMRNARPTTNTDTEWGRTCHDQWWQDVRAVAFFCQKQNPNFNSERWMGYIRGECGKNGGAK